MLVTRFGSICLRWAPCTDSNGCNTLRCSSIPCTSAPGPHTYAVSIYIFITVSNAMSMCTVIVISNSSMDTHKQWMNEEEECRRTHPLDGDRRVGSPSWRFGRRGLLRNLECPAFCVLFWQSCTHRYFIARSRTDQHGRR